MSTSCHLISVRRLRFHMVLPYKLVHATSTLYFRTQTKNTLSTCWHNLLGQIQPPTRLHTCNLPWTSDRTTYLIWQHAVTAIEIFIKFSLLYGRVSFLWFEIWFPVDLLLAVMHHAASHHGQGGCQQVWRVAALVQSLAVGLAEASKERSEAKGGQEVSEFGAAVHDQTSSATKPLGHGCLTISNVGVYLPS